jgi:hypothetical protein
MFGFGIALLVLGKAFSRNDPAWLSNVMRTALDAVPVESSTTLAALPESSASPRPRVILIAALFLVFMSVMCLAGAITGVSSWANGEVIDRFPSQASRALVGAAGVGLFVLALGVYQRQRWAWLLVLIGLGASGLWTVVSVCVSPPNMPEGVPVRAIFAVLAALVMLYWGRWWYAQRVHFARRGAKG